MKSTCEASTRDPRRLAALLASLKATIDERTARGSSPAMSRGNADALRESAPDLLVVLDGARELRSIPGVAELLREGPPVGVAFVCVERDRSALPLETAAMVELDERGIRATVTVRDRVIEQVTPDVPDSSWLEQVGRALAPLCDATPDEPQSSLPSRVGFRELHRANGLDPLDDDSLAAAWSRDPGAPRALLGLTTTGPYEMDLVRDGPHTLVGGTTGSGKSELLQALVAGLAASHRPDELGFVLVDYKGGAAFRDCARLPHTLGLVTDLDEHLTARALASLAAELRRRERLLAEAGAKDLDDYRSRPEQQDADRARLGRLVIVVDEFKALADELPDFVNGLVRIAATGRSLGVHLVLATQRPAGIVTGDMRANISMRICLRVRDRADSEDVIDDPGAAALSEAAPGRAYLRSGDGQLVALQTAHVGGPVEEPHVEQDVTVSVLGPDGLPTCPRPPSAETGSMQRLASDERTTELSTFVDVARRVALREAIRPQPSPWLAPLPAWVAQEELEGRADPSDREDATGTGTTRGVPFGLIDLPREQRQVVARWDPLKDGHVGIIGGSRSGRTTFVRTLITGLAQRQPPSELHVQVLESSPGPLSDLSALPQVGSVVDCTDPMLMRRVVERLGAGLPGGATSLGNAPLVVLVIDGWEAVEEALGRAAGGSGSDDLVRLIRDGQPRGLRVIVTGGRAVGSGRLSSLLDRRFVLPMPDPLDLTLVGLDPAMARRTRAPGRAIDVSDGSEIQVATVGSGPSLEEQIAAVRSLASVDEQRPRRAFSARPVEGGGTADRDHCRPPARSPAGQGSAHRTGRRTRRRLAGRRRGRRRPGARGHPEPSPPLPGHRPTTVGALQRARARRASARVERARGCRDRIRGARRCRRCAARSRCSCSSRATIGASSTCVGVILTSSFSSTTCSPWRAATSRARSWSAPDSSTTREVPSGQAPTRHGPTPPSVVWSRPSPLRGPASSSAPPAPTTATVSRPVRIRSAAPCRGAELSSSTPAACPIQVARVQPSRPDAIAVGTAAHV